MNCTRFAVAASLAASVALPGSAWAKPVYLSCVTVENGSTDKFDVTADEETGAVSIFVPSTGFSQSFRGAFSSNQVAFSDHVIFDYAINRTTLAITVTRINGSVAKGACQLAQAPPKRAF